MDIVRRLTQLFYMFRHDSLRVKEDLEMNSRDFMMLDMIKKFQEDSGMVKMNEISTYFHVTPAAISQIIRSFENKGWVKRVLLENDRRSVYIKVSDSAIQEIKEREALMLSKLLSFIETLGKEDSEAMVRILEKAININKERNESK